MPRRPTGRGTPTASRKTPRASNASRRGDIYDGPYSREGSPPSQQPVVVPTNSATSMSLNSTAGLQRSVPTSASTPARVSTPQTAVTPTTAPSRPTLSRSFPLNVPVPTTPTQAQMGKPLAVMALSKRRSDSPDERHPSSTQSGNLSPIATRFTAPVANMTLTKPSPLRKAGSGRQTTGTRQTQPTSLNQVKVGRVKKASEPKRDHPTRIRKQTLRYGFNDVPQTTGTSNRNDTVSR